MSSSILVGMLVSLLVWMLFPTGTRLGRGGLNKRATFTGLAGLSWRGTGAGVGNTSDLVFTEVASLLRAGVPHGAAWRRAAGVNVDSFGVPDQVELANQVGAEPAMAMVAAAKLALRLGAPLAVVLQTVDDALRTESQTRSDRETALAGPQTTARVLLALPFLGLFLGWVLGANPIRVMFSGGIGTASFVLGATLLAAGRWWINRLIAVAGGNAGLSNDGARNDGAGYCGSGSGGTGTRWTETGSSGTGRAGSANEVWQ